MQKIEYKKRESCAISNSKDFSTILDLGIVPLAGYFPTHEQVISKHESKYPLKLLLCNESKLVQVDSVIDPDVLFKDYRYRSSVGLSKHFNELANILNVKYNIENKNILEIGCNDGVLLEPLSELGAKVEGVDPASNITKVARAKGLSVYDTYFNYENFKDDKFKEKYDLVLANNSFAHITNILDVVKGIQHVLKPNGDFVFEVHYLKNLIDESQWDNIYHEHIYYYSITALHNLFKQYDMTVIDFEEIPIHAGSIRVTVKNAKLDMPGHIRDRLILEFNTICNKDYLYKFQTNVLKHINDFKNQINELSKKYSIAGYGASGRANMFCNLTDLNEKQIQFVVDESPERCGRYIANTKIPIVDIDTLKESKVDLLIIFAWNYSKMIINKTQFRKFKYLVAFPNIQIVENYSELEGFTSI
jgi:SAM-dependent methyltransferase